ncbi:MAG: hypothetical protein RLZZ584_1498 [Pseudomonadota bacterium]
MKTATADTTGRPHVLIINSVLMGGGVDSHTLSLCSACLQAGVRVTLAVARQARWLPRARAIAGLELLELNRHRQTWPLLLARHARAHAVDLIHAHHGRDYWVALLARWFALCRPRVVVTRHLMTTLKDKTRRLLAPPTRVVAVSAAVMGALRRADPAGTLALTQIHCGIDTTVFRPEGEGAGEPALLPAGPPATRAATRAALGYAPDDVVFVVVGPTHGPDGKGQFYFVTAAAQLAQRCPQARFLCVGDGDRVGALRAEAVRLGLADRFSARPFTDDVPALMRAVDVLVHPAVNSEALGLVILEALACARPVIGSALDGIGETFVDAEHGLLVPPRDAPALAAAMERLAGDAALRARYGRAGRAWVEAHFSLTTLGERTARLYREILAEEGARA